MRSQNHDVLRTNAAIIPLRDRCQSAVQGRHRPSAVPVPGGREARPFGQGVKLAERRTIEADEACLAGPVGEQPEQDRPRVGAQNSVRGGRERHFQKLSRGRSRSSEIGTPSGIVANPKPFPPVPRRNGRPRRRRGCNLGLSLATTGPGPSKAAPNVSRWHAVTAEGPQRS